MSALRTSSNSETIQFNSLVLSIFLLLSSEYSSRKGLFNCLTRVERVWLCALRGICGIWGVRFRHEETEKKKWDRSKVKRERKRREKWNEYIVLCVLFVCFMCALCVCVYVCKCVSVCVSVDVSTHFASEDRVMFYVAWLLQAAEPGKFTKMEFISGLQKAQSLSLSLSLPPSPSLSLSLSLSFLIFSSEWTLYRRWGSEWESGGRRCLQTQACSKKCIRYASHVYERTAHTHTHTCIRTYWHTRARAVFLHILSVRREVLRNGYRRRNAAAAPGCVDVCECAYVYRLFWLREWRKECVYADREQASVLHIRNISANSWKRCGSSTVPYTKFLFTKDFLSILAKKLQRHEQRPVGEFFRIQQKRRMPQRRLRLLWPQWPMYVCVDRKKKRYLE